METASKLPKQAQKASPARTKENREADDDEFKICMTEEEFYAKIDRSLASGISEYVMGPEESAEEFLERMLSGR